MSLAMIRWLGLSRSPPAETPESSPAFGHPMVGEEAPSAPPIPRTDENEMDHPPHHPHRSPPRRRKRSHAVFSDPAILGFVNQDAEDPRSQ